MVHCSQVVPCSFCRPECCSTKLESSSLIGMWLFTGSPSFWAAHCSQRCFSIFLPPLISVRWTVAVLLQLLHFMRACPVWRGAGTETTRSIVFPPQTGV